MKMFVYFNFRLVPIQIERELIYVYTMLWPKTTRALITTIGGH